jgi:ATP/maltotriose-dependent transcriptional regulator MalT
MVEESYALAKETQSLDLLLRCCNNVPIALWYYDPDYDRVESILQEGLALARKANKDDMAAWILGTSGYFLAERGDLAEAERFLAEALATAESIAERPLIGMRAQELAWIKLIQGDTEAGVGLKARADPILQENPEAQNQGGGVLISALVAAAQGDPERELAILVEGAIHYVPEAAHADAMFVETIRGLCRAGRAEEARPFVDPLRGLAEAVPSAARLAWAEGLLAEDDAVAAELLRDAVLRFEALGFRIHAARCLMDLAEVERRAGKDVRDDLARARAILEDCGAEFYLRDFEEIPSR